MLTIPAPPRSPRPGAARPPCWRAELALGLLLLLIVVYGRGDGAGGGLQHLAALCDEKKAARQVIDVSRCTSMFQSWAGWSPPSWISGHAEHGWALVFPYTVPACTDRCADGTGWLCPPREAERRGKAGGAGELSGDVGFVSFQDSSANWEALEQHQRELVEAADGRS